MGSTAIVGGSPGADARRRDRIARTVATTRAFALTSVPRYVAAVALTAALAYASVSLSGHGTVTAMWWPAAGAAVLAVLAVPARYRVAAALGLWLVTAAVNHAAGRPPALAVAFGLANAAEAYVVVRVLTLGRERALLGSLRDVRRLLVAALAGAVVIGLLAGVAVATLASGLLLATAVSVAASHGSAVLAIVPLALARRTSRPPVSCLHLVLQPAALVLAVLVVFGPGAELPLPVLPLAALVWGAFVLPARALAAELLVLAAAVTVLSALGHGPFGVTGVHTLAHIGHVQGFLAVSAAAVLCVAAVCAERLRYLARLADQDTARTDFVRAMAHDLRNPAGALTGLLELLRDEVDGPLTDGQRELVSAADDCGRQVLALVDDLRAVARVGAGERALALVPTGLGALVEQACRTAGPAAARKGIELRLVLDPATGTVAADRTQLQRAQDNLVGNAVKYTPDGGQVVVTATGDGGHARVTVADTGIGIPTAELPHLFERFFRASTARASDIPGTGIGLAITHDVVERHGGRLAVDSAPGSGSTFRLELPRIEAAPGAPAAPPRELSASAR